MRALLIALCAFSFAPAALVAQQPRDTISGRVVGADSAPLPAVEIRVRSARTLLLRSVRSDRDGGFRLVFPDTSGAYDLVAQHVGRRPVLLRVTRDSLRPGGPLPFVTVTMSAVVLPAVRAVAGRPVVQTLPGGTYGGVNSSLADTYRWEDRASSDAHGLNASLLDVMGSVPGATVIPGEGVSVNGVSPGGNAFMLNGMRVEGSNLPSLAVLDARVSSATYGAGSGGFTGAEIAMRPFAAYDYRHLLLMGRYLDPALQSAGSARSLGVAQTRDLFLGGRLHAPLRAGWSAVLLGDVTQRREPTPHLFSADSQALAAYALSGDSVARLRTVLSSLGIPIAPNGIALDATFTGVKSYAEVNYDNVAGTRTRPWRPRNAKVWGNWRVDESRSGFSPLAAPTTAAVATRSGTLLGSSMILELPHRVTPRITGQLEVNESDFDPAMAIPAGSVVLPAIVTTDDGNTLPSAQTPVSFGGGGEARHTRTVSPRLRADVRWNSARGHQFVVTSDLSHTSFDETHEGSAGAFAFSSLDALAAGAPSTFVRLLGAAPARASVTESSIDVGDAFRLWGAYFSASVRLEHATPRFDVVRDARVEALVGGDMTTVASRAAITPRLGVSWIPGDQARTPYGRFRGGVSVNRNRLSAGQLASAGTATRRLLYCAGQDVPAPDWSAYATDLTTVPVACGSGASSLADSGAQSARVFSPSFQPSWNRKVELDWERSLPTIARLRIAVTRVDQFALQSTRDANRRVVPAFQLADEAGRPVFVDAAAIDAATGVADSRAARRTSELAQVWETLADGRGQTTQLQIQASRRLWTGTLPWRLTYTYSRSRDLARGIGGPDPNALTWARGAYAPAHQIQFLWPEIALPFQSRLTVIGRLASGRPFTPRVSGDVNGDGQWHDAAFVFDPATVSDPTVRDGILALLHDSPSRVRRCLDSQLGTTASRNSCVGPWLTAADVALRIPIAEHPFRPSNVVIRAQNVLGLADRALHGEERRRGWGDFPTPDGTLLRVRSFDAVTRRYAYDVNPNFGVPRRTAGIARTPFRVSIEFVRDLSRHPDERDLDDFLKRMTPGDTSRAAYFALGWGSSRYQGVLGRRQAFLLTAEQAKRLQELHDAALAAHRKALEPLVLALSGSDPRAERERVRSVRADALTIDLRFRRDAAHVLRDLLSDDQWELVDHRVREDAVPQQQRP